MSEKFIDKYVIDGVIYNIKDTVNYLLIQELINNGTILLIPTKSELDLLEDKSNKVIYITEDENKLYRWDDVNSVLKSLGGGDTSSLATKEELSEGISLLNTKINELPTSTAVTEAVSESVTTSNTYTDTKITELVNSSPEALNTLKELADALGDDPNFATTITTQIGLKANTVDVYNKTDVDGKVETLEDSISSVEDSVTSIENTIGTKASLKTNTFEGTQIIKTGNKELSLENFNINFDEGGIVFENTNTYITTNANSWYSKSEDTLIRYFFNWDNVSSHIINNNVLGETIYGLSSSIGMSTVIIGNSSYIIGFEGNGTVNIIDFGNPGNVIQNNLDPSVSQPSTMDMGKVVTLDNSLIFGTKDMNDYESQWYHAYSISEYGYFDPNSFTYQKAAYQPFLKSDGSSPIETGTIFIDAFYYKNRIYGFYSHWDEGFKIVRSNEAKSVEGQGIRYDGIDSTYSVTIGSDIISQLNNVASAGVGMIDDTVYLFEESGKVLKYNTITNEHELLTINQRTNIVSTNETEKCIYLYYTGQVIKFEDVVLEDSTIKVNNSELYFNDKKIVTEESLDSKVNKVSGKSLISDTEITRLATVVNYDDTEIKSSISGKQNTLVSGTNIKTINGESVLGSGDIEITGGSSEPTIFTSNDPFNGNPNMDESGNLVGMVKGDICNVTYSTYVEGAFEGSHVTFNSKYIYDGSQWVLEGLPILINTNTNEKGVQFAHVASFVRNSSGQIVNLDSIGSDPGNPGGGISETYETRMFYSVQTTITNLKEVISGLVNVYIDGYTKFLNSFMCDVVFAKNSDTITINEVDYNKSNGKVTIIFSGATYTIIQNGVYMTELSAEFSLNLSNIYAINGTMEILTQSGGA